MTVYMIVDCYNDLLTVFQDNVYTNYKDALNILNKMEEEWYKFNGPEDPKCPYTIISLQVV